MYGVSHGFTDREIRGFTDREIRAIGLFFPLLLQSLKNAEICLERYVATQDYIYFFWRNKEEGYRFGVPCFRGSSMNQKTGKKIASMTSYSNAL